MKNDSNNNLPKTFIYAFLVILISVGVYFYLSKHPPPSSIPGFKLPPGSTSKTFTGAKPKGTGKINSAKPPEGGGNRLFTAQELKEYTGSYLSILGEVYDVSSKPHHYGPGGGYHFFTGRDASRAFTTGEFNEKGLREDIQGLTSSQVVGIWEWLGTYRQDYPRVGYLIGHWYDEAGKPTPALERAYRRYQRGLQTEKEESAQKKGTPSCNLEWNPQSRTVSCRDGSGGVQRGWDGILRKRYRRSDRVEECVCVHITNTEKDTQKYQTYESDGCPRNARSCTWDSTGKLLSHQLEEA